MKHRVSTFVEARGTAYSRYGCSSFSGYASLEFIDRHFLLRRRERRRSRVFLASIEFGVACEAILAIAKGLDEFHG